MQSKIIDLSNKNHLNFGDAFKHLYPATHERLFVVHFDQLGVATEHYLFGIGQEHNVYIDTSNMSTYIQHWVPFGFGLVHNHPSGTMPSGQDETLNQWIAKIAKQHGKKFLNHAVIGKRVYYMKEMQPLVFDSL